MNNILENKIRANFEYAVNNFDFSRVHKVMRSLDWSWWNTDGTPTQQDMIGCVTELFEMAVKGMQDSDENFWCSSGGFHVEIWNTGSVRIEFVAESSEVHER